MHHCVLACFRMISNTPMSTHFLRRHLCLNNLNSYRPVSNLSFISKILEKVEASRLRSHISSNCLSNVSQSAYKEFHSTETALLKVHNDITLNIDKGKVTALTLVVGISFSILTFSSPWSTSPSGCARSPLAGMIAPSSD